jgi:hypothetical protein
MQATRLKAVRYEIALVSIVTEVGWQGLNRSVLIVS